MRLALAILVALTQVIPVANAHGYRVGSLEIVHPAIMVPGPQSDCSCAHVKFINHGTRSEYFLGATISASSRTHLLHISQHGDGFAMPQRVEIPPGQTLDLHRHEWCLFMSGITQELQADMGAVSGRLRFEGLGEIAVEFMIDATGH
jgi:copper(I)-binding protein